LIFPCDAQRSRSRVRSKEKALNISRHFKCAAQCEVHGCTSAARGRSRERPHKVAESQKQNHCSCAVGFNSPVDAADTGEEKSGKRASCRGKYHAVIFRVGLVLGIFRAWGGYPVGTSPRVSFSFGYFSLGQARDRYLGYRDQPRLIVFRIRRRRKKNSRATIVNQV